MFITRRNLSFWSLALAAGCGGGGDSGVVSGLDGRVANPSCRAPARAPVSGSEGLAARLSETGCFRPGDPAAALPGLIPYDVNAALWSDGAAKDRWLALPDGANIEIKPGGDLELPPGAVTIKTFILAGRRVETRFFVRLMDGAWFGYTYAWNDAGTDATLLGEGGERRVLGDREWQYPTRAECKQCHTEAAGFSLGLEIAQLNRDLQYPSGRSANQIDTWVHLGLFRTPPQRPSEQLARLPDPRDSGRSLEARARAYLHANCANCHRPEVDSSGVVDLRHTTTLVQTMGCEARPQKGTQGFGPDVRVIAPGRPELSMLLLRMRLEGAGRMPEVATLQVDQEGAGLVSDWIRSLAGCQ